MSSYGTQVAGRLPCWACDSSDAAVIYQDREDPKRYYGICYSEKGNKEKEKCFKEFTQEEALNYIRDNGAMSRVSSTPAKSTIVEVLPEYEQPRKPIRGIPVDVLDLYGVRVITKDGETQAHCYPLYVPKGEDVELAAYKLRLPKDSEGNKRFDFVKTYPEATRDAVFFGQQAKFKTSRTVMVTEGELDAMSAYAMLGTKMPVVSIKHGAGDTQLNDTQKKYLDQFSTIYLCFDADDSGKKAARKFSQHFPGDKVRLVQLGFGLKDANEALQHHKLAEFNAAVQNAKSIVKEGLVLGRETKKYLFEEPEKLIPYPWDALNEMAYGVSDGGELVTILSGSGLGKSTVMKHLGLHWFETWKDCRIGCLFIEENKKKTVKIMTGMYMEKNIILPDAPAYTQEEAEEAWGRLFDNDRWVLWDHWGSNTIDSVIDTVRYMVSNFGAKVILLDHITIVLSGGTHGGDERKAIDELMTKLRALVNELEFVCIAISHLKKNDGVPHEEGGRVKMSDARGSGSIYHLSDTVIGLERNGQAENRVERSVTNLRVLKSRLSGETGPAGRLLYNKSKGTLRELTEEDYQKLLDTKDEDTQDMLMDDSMKEWDDIPLSPEGEL